MRTLARCGDSTSAAVWKARRQPTSVLGLRCRDEKVIKGLREAAPARGVLAGARGAGAESPAALDDTGSRAGSESALRMAAGFAALVALLAALIAAGVAMGRGIRGPWHAQAYSLDHSIALWVRSCRCPVMDALMGFFSGIGEMLPMALITA